MTCIVGWIENGTITMGGDSVAMNNGYYSEARANPKVFRNGPYLIGWMDSFRMGQLLQYTFQPPTPTTNCDLLRFMVNEFISTLRTCLKEGGYASIDNKVEEGGTFLVGICGRLFTVQNDYQVAERLDSYAAIGCGRDFALGALHALDGCRMSARARVEAALEAAAHLSSWVRPPFTIKQLRS